MTRSLHLLGSGDTNKGEHQGERHADGIASGQTGTRKLGVDGTALARQHLAGSVEAVEVAGKLLGKVRQTERGAVASAAGDEVGELVELTRKGKLGRAFSATAFMPISSACSGVTSAARRRMEHTRA